jgi:hypothetical protein
MKERFHLSPAGCENEKYNFGPFGSVCSFLPLTISEILIENAEGLRLIALLKMHGRFYNVVRPALRLRIHWGSLHGI